MEKESKMERSDSNYQVDYEENVLRRTRKAIRDLNTLRNEHNSLINSIQIASKGNADLDTHFRDERLNILKDSQEAIDLALEEAEVTMFLANHLQYLEGEKLKLRAQVSLLKEENDWLRKELLETQGDLMKCQQKLVVVEEKNKHFEFMKELKMDDSREGSEEGSEGSGRPFSFDMSFLDDLPSDTGSPGYEIPARFRSLYDLVTQYVTQGRHQVALTLCKQSIQNLEKTGTYNPDEAIVLHMQARIFKDMGNTREAIKTLKSALHIRENTLGNDHPSVAAILNNLAVMYGRNANYKDAENMCKRALEIKEKIFGSYHTAVAKMFNNLALLCQNQNKYDQAEYYYQRALEIYLTLLGPDHVTVMKTKNNRASAFLRQGKYRQAEEIYKDILIQFCEKEFGHFEDDNNRPQLTPAEQENGGILLYYIKRLCDRCKMGLDVFKNPALITALVNMGILNRIIGKSDEAALFEESVVRLKKKNSHYKLMTVSTES